MTSQTATKVRKYKVIVFPGLGRLPHVFEARSNEPAAAIVSGMTAIYPGATAEHVGSTEDGFHVFKVVAKLGHPTSALVIADELG